MEDGQAFQLTGDIGGRIVGDQKTGHGRRDQRVQADAENHQDGSRESAFCRDWEDVAVAMHVSAYSLKTLAEAFVPLMRHGGAFVGLDFDNRQAWPAYNWMGVAKSALQSVNRYLARELGPKQIRFNLVAAGPVRTMAAKSIPGFALFEDTWDGRAPLGWDVNNAEPVARACVALLSDWFPATTGEIIHVDGGYHAVGA